MANHKRCGNKWNINELLSLQREYELLEWNIQDIAFKHKRSISAILYKLEEEGFILSWSEARGFNASEYKNQLNGIEEEDINEDDEDYEQEDDDDEDYDLEEDEEEEEEEDYDNEVNNDKEIDLNKLTERVWNLETNLSDISSMVKQMFNNLVLKKTTTRAPLRSNKN